MNDSAFDTSLPARVSCPACSGRAHYSVLRVETHSIGVYTCEGCAGLIRPRPILRRFADLLVGLDRPMEAEAEDAVYFNLSVRSRSDEAPRRIHGWYSPSRTRVVQIG